ncbi:hypothetical protein ACH49_13515 [Streptomyces leeuwenhoekii]|uniref:Secreted Protein n=1 Tax=Streptomyces leeuwenhoekii TaxID=1437453 RepID=A0ABR5HZ32_STRLW|nr:hypothetical protein [Streptomyces leeuwenhoekii]KMS79072.1 hypothetical protein ACH49_13515 [Streptomyces leeuwenhoekii]
MSQFAAALAGAITAVGVGAVAVARSWPTASGRHRAPQRGAEAKLLRPVEALDTFEAYCPAEDRPTLQLRLRLGGSVCTECRLPTTSITTPGDPQ